MEELKKNELKEQWLKRSREGKMRSNPDLRQEQEIEMMPSSETKVPKTDQEKHPQKIKDDNSPNFIKRNNKLLGGIFILVVVSISRLFYYRSETNEEDLMENKI